MGEITGAAAKGVNSLWDIAPVVSILVLAIMVLLYFIRGLLMDAKEERKANRDALIGNTAVLARLEELILATVSK